jgi:cytidyltransferase-like protein
MKIKKMKKIFVSGTYDILHAGHIQFFKEAKSLGDYLIVSFCSETNLMLYKNRHASIPDDNKKILLESIRYIDKVVQGNDDGGVWDFIQSFLEEKPDVLVVTTDDKYSEEKRIFCEKNGVELIILPKNPPVATPVSTSDILNKIIKNGVAIL